MYLAFPVLSSLLSSFSSLLNGMKSNSPKFLEDLEEFLDTRGIAEERTTTVQMTEVFLGAEVFLKPDGDLRMRAQLLCFEGLGLSKTIHKNKTCKNTENKKATYFKTEFVTCPASSIMEDL